MKKLKFVPIFMAIFLIFIFLAACKSSESKTIYKTAEPLSTYRYNNIFKIYSSKAGKYFDAKEISINDDFSADIVYEITGKTLAKDGEDKKTNSISKEDIIDAIDLINKEIYKYDNKYKLYDQNNRVLYLDEDSITETPQNETDAKTSIIIFNVHVTNLNYVCTYYKLMSLEDYIKSEDEKNPNGKQAYYKFRDKDSLEKRIIGMDNPEKYKVLVLESYSPSVETKFTFDGKILAYYSPENKGCEINKDSDSLTITPKNDNSIVAVAYRINQNDINWAILGPVIGIVTIFLILLSIRIIKSVKAPHKKRGY